MNTIIEPSDQSMKSIDSIVNYFKMIYLCHCGGLDRSNFYCGITNDVRANLYRHKINGYVACVKCASFEVSSRVEAELGKLGFDIGNSDNLGNGGTNDSKIVYMAYKENSFNK